MVGFLALIICGLENEFRQLSTLHSTSTLDHQFLLNYLCGQGQALIQCLHLSFFLTLGPLLNMTYRPYFKHYYNLITQAMFEWSENVASSDEASLQILLATTNRSNFPQLWVAPPHLL